MDLNIVLKTAVEENETLINDQFSTHHSEKRCWLVHLTKTLAYEIPKNAHKNAEKSS